MLKAVATGEKAYGMLVDFMAIDDAIAALPDTVLAIAAYWRMSELEKKSVSAGLRSFASPGRNDPCPCGSGKKFKKCCGTGS